MELARKSGLVTSLLLTTALAVTSYTGTRKGAHTLSASVAGSGELTSIIGRRRVGTELC